MIIAKQGQDNIVVRHKRYALRDGHSSACLHHRPSTYYGSRRSRYRLRWKRMISRRGSSSANYYLIQIPVHLCKDSLHWSRIYQHTRCCENNLLKSIPSEERQPSIYFLSLSAAVFRRRPHFRRRAVPIIASQRLAPHLRFEQTEIINSSALQYSVCCPWRAAGNQY